MTWNVVARKDFSDAIRSKALWALSGLFVLLAAGAAYLFTVLINVAEAPFPGGLTVSGLAQILMFAIGWLVPLTGLAVGYKSVAGEVESGTSKILLSLPHDRRDVVTGKLLGRISVLVLPILVGFAAAAVVVLALYESFAAADFAAFTLLTVALGATFVSLGVGISAATKSTGTAAAAMFSVYVLFQFLWQIIPRGVNFLVNQTLAVPNPAPDWYVFLYQFRPQNAYSALVNSALDGGNSVIGSLSSPFATVGFAVAVLLFWFVVPVTLGYLKFRAADL